jgi:hypothetical protein
MPKGDDPAKRRKKSATRPRSIVARAGRAPRPSIASEPHGDLNKLLAEPRRMKILAMIKAASHVYLVADSTKINRSSFTRLGTLDVINSFVADDGIREEDARAFRKSWHQGDHC